MINTNTLTDKYELYSFMIYLYLNEFIYIYAYHCSWIYMIFIHVSINILTYSLYRYTIFHLLNHPYWKYHLYDIVIPHVITSISNIIILYYFVPVIYSILYHLSIEFFLWNYYSNELSISKNIRLLSTIFIMTLLFLV